jgi:type I restriction enzyme S subunit
MPKLSLNASKKTKHTSAGEIPVDWGTAVLSDIIENLESGVSVSGEDRPANANESGVLRVSAVSKGRFFPKENKAILPADLKRARMRPRAGAILVSRSNTPDLVGESARVPGSFPNLFLPDKLWQVCLRPETPTDEGWLSYVLQFPDVRRLISERASGTSKSMRNISKPSFLSIPIPLPPLPEQQRIADILFTWDRAIETLESLIAAKERRKQALMEQLLSGRKRLPGFKGKWGKVKLSELLTPIIRATAKPSSPFLAAGIRCHGRGVFLKPDFKPADIMLDELYEIQTNDLVVNITFAWEGAIAIVPEEANGALVSHRFPTYLFKQDLTCSEFFRHVIQTHGFVFECGLASPGGAGRNRVLSKKNFLKIAIPCPDLQEQQAIAAVLDTADRELTLHRQHLATLRTQKRGLMGKLLTGAIRTPNK